MFYRADEPHGFAVDPFKACIVPRPIGWISTISEKGVHNLAPYSFFNAVAESPKMLMVCINGTSSGGRIKDTLANVLEVPEFVANLATFQLRDQMNRTSSLLDAGIDEFAYAKLGKSKSKMVRPARVTESLVHMECAVHDLIDLPETEGGARNVMILGRVLGIHIDEAVLHNGRVDIESLRPIGRLGYSEYVDVAGRDIFRMRWPES